MELSELRVQLENKLKTSSLSARTFLDRFRLIDESSRNTAAYNDPKYAPFYYHLGSLIQPKNMVEIGFQLGLLSGCFLKSCKTVDNFAAFQESSDNFYSTRIGRSNIRSLYKGKFNAHVGKFYDPEWFELFNSSKWDVIFLNEEMEYAQHMDRMESIWSQVAFNGLIVMDYINFHKPAQQAFLNFCKTKGRVPISIDTRYGVGVIVK